MGLFRKKIGLALGSGAARGLAHIGVIKELEKNNIAINCIAGASIGAVIGGLYAYTRDINIVEKLAYSSGYKEFASAFWDPSLKSSVFKGDKVLDLLSDYIPENALIEDTRIPFIAVATDIETAETVFLKNGNLRQAIRASMSLPVLLQPVDIDGQLLIDGGTTDPVPIDALKLLGAQRTIGVNLYTQMFPKKFEQGKLNMVDVIKAFVEIPLYTNSKQNMNNADVQLHLPINGELPLTAFAEDPTELIKLGEEETRKYINKLKML